MAHIISRQYMLNCGATMSPGLAGATVTVQTSNRIVWQPSEAQAWVDAQETTYARFPEQRYTNHFYNAYATGIERHTLQWGRFYITWLEEHEVKA